MFFPRSRVIVSEPRYGALSLLLNPVRSPPCSGLSALVQHRRPDRGKVA